ncbi:MAG: sugar ABC transporter permease [Anaerolineaceae bacterium]|nr:MAG: sugar ABC transporter permease [Anaerolineaceae bacterium]
MQDNIRFDRLWARAVAIFTVLFLGWFILQEWRGFEPFFRLLWDAVMSTPSAIAYIVNYYGDVETSALFASLGIGAVFGGLVTAFVFVKRQKIITVPRILPGAFWSGVAVAAVFFLFEASMAIVLLSLLVGVVVASYLLDIDTRLFLSKETRQALGTPTARRWMWRGLAVGAIAGAVGSQLLVVPTRHCTFAGDVDPTARWMGYAITLIGALVVLIPAWTFTLRRRGKSTDSTSGYFKGWSTPLLLLVPTLLSLLVFLYYPSFRIAAQSLLRERRGRGAEPTFDCLNNYVNLMNDSVYQNSFMTTITVTVAVVVLSMSVALLIALLASQRVRGANVYRTLLIWPYALSPVVTAAIFISMFRDDRSGLINHMLNSIGADTVRWITDATVAPWVLIAAAVYNILGFNIIFYVAGLQNVPRDLLEAAQIDGANVLQRFFKITIPLLSPYTFFLLVANVTYSFYGIYGVIDTLFPGGGPLLADGQSRAANVLIYKVYEDTFRSGAIQLGNVAAQSIVLFVLVAGITLLQFRYLETRVTYAD